MRRLRIAVYHNLRPGGALRALDELLRRSCATHDYDLFESARSVVDRAAAGMGLALDSSCRSHHVFEMPELPMASVKLGHAHVLRQVWQLERLESEIAGAIDAGGYDLAFVHPCHVRYTPAILTKLRTPVVYYMQEARRPTFEYRVRHRRRASWGSGATGAARSLAVLSGALAEPVLVRGDQQAARAPGVYVLANSAFSAERILASYGVRAHLSYLGVDAERFHPGSDGAAVADARPYVVSVGRGVAAKRHDLVIEALGALPEATRPELVIAGEGPATAYEDHLRDTAAELGVAVRLLRAVDDEGLVDLYRRAVVTVCAAELEPFGLTVLESISCGTPVVAVREGGFRESVRDGVTGLLVEPTARGLSDGVARVLADPGRYDPRSLHASIAADAWTWDDAAARLHGHFAAASDERAR